LRAAPVRRRAVAFAAGPPQRSQPWRAVANRAGEWFSMGRMHDTVACLPPVGARPSRPLRGGRSRSSELGRMSALPGRGTRDPSSFPGRAGSSLGADASVSHALRRVTTWTRVGDASLRGCPCSRRSRSIGRGGCDSNPALCACGAVAFRIVPRTPQGRGSPHVRSQPEGCRSWSTGEPVEHRRGAVGQATGAACRGSTEGPEGPAAFRKLYVWKGLRHFVAHVQVTWSGATRITPRHPF
jgi:hypothetical protein